MGNVFRRSSGRGWKLRRRSMELWPQWLAALQTHQPNLKLHLGLLQIAEDEQAAERMESLAAQRVDLGLQMITPADLSTVWPCASHGGLHSRHDGRIDPLLLQLALRQALEGKSVELNATTVVRLERDNHHWRVHRATGDSAVHDVVWQRRCRFSTPAWMVSSRAIGGDRPPGPRWRARRLVGCRRHDGRERSFILLGVSTKRGLGPRVPPRS